MYVEPRPQVGILGESFQPFGGNSETEGKRRVVVRVA